MYRYVYDEYGIDPYSLRPFGLYSHEVIYMTEKRGSDDHSDRKQSQREGREGNQGSGGNQGNQSRGKNQ